MAKLLPPISGVEETMEKRKNSQKRKKAWVVSKGNVHGKRHTKYSLTGSGTHGLTHTCPPATLRAINAVAPKK